MEYNADKKEIRLDKKLSKLDELVMKFVNIVEKHADYVIMSGYVSILLGRSRATEDVDLFIRKMSLEKFSELYTDLEENNFWCLNAEKAEEIYSFLKDGLAVRFSIKDRPIPNFEMKFPKRTLDDETFDDMITVKLPNNKIKISSLERQIAFKRYFLKADKDIEDALHIEELFKDKLNYEKINKLKEAIKNISDWYGKRIYETR
ncbi:MAG: nucleotidyltransferase [Nanoarchaeota archaeon]|nr:nucleotidyltransferase [Nanoarchaeota archaeon]